jgi:TusA-related sulfurtransferase
MKEQQDENIIVYDIRGQICPSCLLFTLREVNNHRTKLKESGTQILIQTDNRDATATIPDAVLSMGYDYSITKKEGYYEITIMAHQKKKTSD